MYYATGHTLQNLGHYEWVLHNILQHFNHLELMYTVYDGKQLNFSIFLTYQTW